MITVFNRKELLITYDTKKQSDVRTMLRDHKIPYDVKVKNGYQIKVVEENNIKINKYSKTVNLKYIELN